MPHGKDYCKWLKRGGLYCEKSCLDTYCKIHRMRLRNGSAPPEKCEKCGFGTTMTNPTICTRCAPNLHAKLQRTEKRQHRLHFKLMREINEAAEVIGKQHMYIAW